MSAHVTVRMTAGHRALLESAAREGGHKTASAYVRGLISGTRGASGGPAPFFWGPREIKVLQEMTVAVNRAGALLNQKVRGVNLIAVKMEESGVQIVSPEHLTAVLDEAREAGRRTVSAVDEMNAYVIETVENARAALGRPQKRRGGRAGG